MRLIAPIFVLALATSAAAAPGWTSRTIGKEPVAEINAGGGTAMTVGCFAAFPSYHLAITGPANGLRPGHGIKGEVRGRQTVKLRFREVSVDAAGRATLTTSGGGRGSIGDQSGALYALEAIRTAKKPVTITAGSFSATLPAAGAEAAFAPLVARCGALKPMANRAWHREYGGG